MFCGDPLTSRNVKEQLFERSKFCSFSERGHIWVTNIVSREFSCIPAMRNLSNINLLYEKEEYN